jgi:hypothetical protein
MISFCVVSIAISCVILSSPGDIIGYTAYDYQGRPFGQRLYVDDYNQAHIDWMKMDAAQSVRFCAWNARFTDDTYFGET